MRENYVAGLKEPGMLSGILMGAVIIYRHLLLPNLPALVREGAPNGGLGGKDVYFSGACCVMGE